MVREPGAHSGRGHSVAIPGMEVEAVLFVLGMGRNSPVVVV